MPAEGINQPRYSSDVGKTEIVKGSTTRFDEGPERVIQTSRGTEWGRSAWKEDEDGNEVPGTRRWYPRGIMFADGSVTLREWAWKAGGRPDDLGVGFLGQVEFTPDEWQVHQALSDDAQLKAMDWQVVVTLYYSLGRWMCKCGNWRQVGAKLSPSLASPSSTDTCDPYKLDWLERWELTLRDRIWRLRPELRSVTLPDGRTVRGLIPPSDRVFRPPPCSSALSMGLQALTAAVMAAGGAGVLYSVIEQAIKLPSTIADLKEALRVGAVMRDVQQFVQVGPGEAPGELVDRAGGGGAFKPADSPPVKPGVGIAILLAAGAAAWALAR